MKVRFKNPPINEVVIGAYFDPPLVALRNEHIGLLWSKFRDEFPTVEQRPPIEINLAQPPNPILPVDDEFMVMPRYWFVSEDEVTLIQVQKNAFLLNWRRCDSEYPHFAENLQPGFGRHYQTFEEFLKKDVCIPVPTVSFCELTYVNMIEPVDYWQGPQDTPNVIQPFSILGSDQPDGSVPTFNCTYRFEVGPDLQLQVAIRSVQDVDPPRSPRLIFEIKALGSPKSDTVPGSDAWYDRAHDAIVAQFLSMTNERIQREFWALEGAEGS